MFGGVTGFEPIPSLYNRDALTYLSYTPIIHIDRKHKNKSGGGSRT